MNARHMRSLLFSLSALSFHSIVTGNDQRLTLEISVNPDTRFYNQGKLVKFAIDGFIELETLNELFLYVDKQAGRWHFDNAAERQAFAGKLFGRGLESRFVSMEYERPLELLKTHTPQEVRRAVTGLKTPFFQGRYWQLTRETYVKQLLRVQARWNASLNCWSASPVIAARVLSNWYLIDEGITLFGATYDSTEHFWQAVKYHPEVRLKDLITLLDLMKAIDWPAWLEALDRDQGIYLANEYAVEFLRSNLKDAHRQEFRRQIEEQMAKGGDLARVLQQREAGNTKRFRFTPLEEKTLWGDLADLFHLIYFFNTIENGRFRPTGMSPLLEGLKESHFDGIYLAGHQPEKMQFISPQFRALMLEIWRVKYLRMRRFGDVIRSTRGVRLDHFLNDGDSPDIPIPIYVGYLNQIRDLAFQQESGR
jgi:hypothetical protein